MSYNRVGYLHPLGYEDNYEFNGYLEEEPTAPALTGPPMAPAVISVLAPDGFNPGGYPTLNTSILNGGLDPAFTSWAIDLYTDDDLTLIRRISTGAAPVSGTFTISSADLVSAGGVIPENPCKLHGVGITAGLVEYATIRQAKIVTLL